MISTAPATTSTRPGEEITHLVTPLASCATDWSSAPASNTANARPAFRD
jgi:hypothetical protein